MRPAIENWPAVYCILQGNIGAPALGEPGEEAIVIEHHPLRHAPPPPILHYEKLRTPTMSLPHHTVNARGAASNAQSSLAGGSS